MPWVGDISGEIEDLFGSLDSYIVPEDGLSIYQTAERTGKHLCSSCLAEVDAETYFELDTLCSDCHDRESEPSPFRGGHPNGFSPIEDADVREQIGRRGSLRA